MSEKAWVKSLDRVALSTPPGLEGLFGRLIQPSDDNGGMAMGKAVLPVGCDMGWHAHPEPEVFVVLAGEGEATWEESGQRHEAKLESGSAFFKVGGIEHRMANTGDRDLVGLFFKIAATWRD
jgi:quercetin dioxygenase-like cupin family protein